MSSTAPLRLVLFGPQGSGKGTQAELLAQKYGIPSISPGALYREHIKNNTAIGKEVKKYLDAGELAPVGITNRMMQERISEPDCARGFIFDGYPRNLAQFEAFTRMPEATAAIAIDLSDQEAVRRLSARRVCERCDAIYHLKNKPPKQAGICDACGRKLIQRDDDTPAAIRARLRIYREESEPLLEKFAVQGKLIRVDGAQSIEKVFSDIEHALSRHI